MKFSLLRDIVVTVCFLLLLGLIAMKVKDDQARAFAGRYRIVDGDSLALGAVRFRLMGIDAPELSQTCRRSGTDWSCGAAAKAVLEALAADGELLCKGGEKDRYQRLLVTCFRKDMNINREMVRRGLAVAFGGYEREEAEARRAHAGLWAADFVRPSDWRRTHRAIPEDRPHLPGLLGRLFGGEG